MGSFPAVTQGGSVEGGRLVGPASMQVDDQWEGVRGRHEGQVGLPRQSTRSDEQEGLADAAQSLENWPLGQMFHRREGGSRGSNRTPEREGARGPRHRRYGSNVETLDEVHLFPRAARHQSVPAASGSTTRHRRCMSVGYPGAQELDISDLADAVVAQSESEHSGQQQGQQGQREQASPWRSGARETRLAGALALDGRGSPGQQVGRIRPSPQLRLEEYLARTAAGGNVDSSACDARLDARKGTMVGSPPLPPSRSLRSGDPGCKAKSLQQSRSGHHLQGASRLSSDSSPDSTGGSAGGHGRDYGAMSISKSSSQRELSLRIWEGSGSPGARDQVQPRPAQWTAVQGVTTVASWPGGSASHNEQHVGANTADGADQPPVGRELSFSTSRTAGQDKASWGPEPSGRQVVPHNAHLSALPQAPSMETASQASARLAPSGTQTGPGGGALQPRLPEEHAEGAGSGKSEPQGVHAGSGAPALWHQDQGAGSTDYYSDDTRCWSTSKGTPLESGNVQGAHGAGQARLAGSKQPDAGVAADSVEQWLAGTTVKAARSRLDALKRDSRLQRKDSWEAEDILKAWSAQSDHLEGGDAGWGEGSPGDSTPDGGMGGPSEFGRGRPTHRRAPSWNPHTMDAPGVVRSQETSLPGFQSALGRLSLEEEAALWADEEEDGAGNEKVDGKASGRARVRTVKKMLHRARKKLAGFSRSHTMHMGDDRDGTKQGGSGSMGDKLRSSRSRFGHGAHGGPSAGSSPGSIAASGVPRSVTEPSFSEEGSMPAKTSPRTIQVTFPWKEGHLPSPERPAAPHMRFEDDPPSERLEIT